MCLFIHNGLIYFFVFVLLFLLPSSDRQISIRAVVCLFSLLIILVLCKLFVQVQLQLWKAFQSYRQIHQGNVSETFLISTFLTLTKFHKNSLIYLPLAFCCRSLLRALSNIFDGTQPADNSLLKVNNRDTRKRCEICSKLTIEIPERRQWHHPTRICSRTLKIFFQFLLLSFSFFYFCSMLGL